MVTTVAVVVATHNLAYGVLAGVLLASLFFAHKISQFLTIDSALSEDKQTRTYRIVGQVFFPSANRFIDAFDLKEDIRHVVIDLTRAHFWDVTSVAALDKVVMKLRREGATVVVLGLNEASATIVDRFAIHDKPDAADKILEH